MQGRGCPCGVYNQSVCGRISFGSNRRWLRLCANKGVCNCLQVNVKRFWGFDDTRVLVIVRTIECVVKWTFVDPGIIYIVVELCGDWHGYWCDCYSHVLHNGLWLIE